MIVRLIEWTLGRPKSVLAFAVLLLLAGVFALSRQKVEAYPDISAQMVQVITTYEGRAPEEVERQVTVPIEVAMQNVPRVETVRSRTIFGLSVVQLVFEEGVELYWARQRVQERLLAASIPDSVHPELGPPATAYGEIFRYELVSKNGTDATALRELNDWVVIPRLLRTPGIAEVSNFGGFEKEFTVFVDPARLREYGMATELVADAIRNNNESAGGSVVRRGSMSYVVRGSGTIRDVHDLEQIFLKNVGGTPIYLGAVANIEVGHKPPSGIFARNLGTSGVEGIVLMRRGENPGEVLKALDRSIATIRAQALPAGVELVPFYSRGVLVDSTIHTVSHSVALGIALILLVLIFFLGRPRMALLVAGTVPLALLVAILCTWSVGINLGLLSIGAIDFGIIVEGSVVIAENIARELGHQNWNVPQARRAEMVHRAIVRAAKTSSGSLALAAMLIIAAYLPLLSLQRIEGLLFRPMALTMIFAMVGALFYALLVVPALSVLLFKNGYSEWHNPMVDWISNHYQRLLTRMLRMARPLAVAGLAIPLLITGGLLPRLGTEFLPQLDEGVFWVRSNFPEGTSLEQTAEYGRRLRELALTNPDVSFVTAQAGRNDSGTDPFPPSRLELMIGPKPIYERTRYFSRAALADSIASLFRSEFPTTRFNFTQPIIDSVTEDTNGTSANLAIELSGPDIEGLRRLASKTRRILESISGSADVAIEQEGPQPQLVVEPDRALCARYGVPVERVTDMINLALGGESIGTIFEGDRRFDIAVRFHARSLQSPTTIGNLPVETEPGRTVPLSLVAKIRVLDGQTIVARENGRRRLTVRTDIQGRDQGSFAEEAKARLDRELQLGDSVQIAWLGMFQNLARARNHFAIVIPVTLLAIFALLYFAFRSLRYATLALLPVPLALFGAVWALYIREMHFNVSTGVGLATVFSVALLDSVLMLRAVQARIDEGMDSFQAVVRARIDLFRPAWMTVLAAVLGLVPAAFASGLGSDAQRPIATVIIAGLLASSILMHLIAPCLYAWVLRGSSVVKVPKSV